MSTRHSPEERAARPRTAPALILSTLMVAFFLMAVPAFGQQTYVTKYDVFTGYTFLDSPHISLFENGFHAQFGVRPRTWLSLGIDWSITKGDLTLTPDLLTTADQQLLAQLLAGLAAAGISLPAGYSPVVPSSSVTHSMAMGPQFAYRHFPHLTLFIRPSFGAIHEKATPTPTDTVGKMIVSRLAPNGSKTDWQGFYGFGGGFDILLSKHFGWRVQSDLVWDHLFNDVLKDGRWTVRFSVGPCFNFGKNIAE